MRTRPPAGSASSSLRFVVGRVIVCRPHKCGGRRGRRRPKERGPGSLGPRGFRVTPREQSRCEDLRWGREAAARYGLGRERRQSGQKRGHDLPSGRRHGNLLAEHQFGRLKHEYGLSPLRVRRLCPRPTARRPCGARPPRSGARGREPYRSRRKSATHPPDEEAASAWPNRWNRRWWRLGRARSGFRRQSVVGVYLRRHPYCPECRPTAAERRSQE